MDISSATKDTQDWRDLAPLEGWCKVIDMYDGDTCWVAIDLNNYRYNPSNPANKLWLTNAKIRKVNVRIARINAPEIKGGTDESKAAARASRDFARSLLLGKIVKFRFGNFGLIKGESLDSFHRQIGELDIPSYLMQKETSGIVGGAEFINFSDLMLTSGHASLFSK